MVGTCGEYRENIARFVRRHRDVFLNQIADSQHFPAMVTGSVRTAAGLSARTIS
jgi:hypothetical protein